MKTMILAAGVGERMRPLTRSTPKPLLRLGGIPLIEHHIRSLAAAGLRELVINVSHLGQQIIDYCGDGFLWGVTIDYTQEDEPLETAGGIQRALPLLGDEPFLVVNSDIWCDYPFANLLRYQWQAGETAHLVMVGNRPQHPLGDFRLEPTGRLRRRPPDLPGLTYAGIALFKPEFFAELKPGKQPLRPLFDDAIDRGTLGGERYEGEWEDVGTPERLVELGKRLNEGRSAG